ncbi:GroES-like protein [Epithele typhae]|uniref:GroES-like protein n=1 Tax=Epithele typhae TaxID=378194 RepID=UPI002008446B|nr:GroES-like protein [Epithele typhae]KAH9928551.1 GroES-like protein [Epithele typhae]
MTSEILATMRAAIIEEGRKFEIKSHAVPVVGDNDILVKTVAVALNPTDWKHVAYSAGIPGSILGCDFSGTVVKVGSAVQTVSVGQSVTGFVHGGLFPDEGAFAEYVKTQSDLVLVIPEDTLTHEEAAAIGCAFWTAVQALFHPTRLGLTEPPAKTSNDEWILVYGGSTAVSQSAVQLATLAGYKVVSTASPHNFEFVKSLRASAVFDYHAPDVVGQIKVATGDGVVHAMDSIPSVDPLRICAESIGPAGGNVVQLVLAPVPGVTERKDVAFKPALIYSALGREWVLPNGTTFPVSEGGRTHMVSFLKKLPELVKSGAVKPLPIKHWEGGLDGIADGLQYMRDGKVGAEKIVYRL